MHAVDDLLVYGLRELGTESVRYVGQTRFGLARRLAQHVRSSRANRPKYLVHQWIKDLGEDRVEIVVLARATSETVLDQLERLHISVLRESGAELFNSQVGGSSACQTFESRAKRSASLSGERHYNYGKTHPPETRSKLSRSRRNRPPEGEETRAKRSERWSGSGNPNVGREFSTDQKELLSRTAKARNHKRWHTDRGKVNPDCELCAS